MTATTPIIMIIEDEALVRQITAMEFEDAGFEVVTLAHGEPALDILAGEDRIDLLFTDISLPNSIDGWTIARRAREIRPRLPVIYCTGYSADPLQLVAGARFFKKPYLPAAVIASAQELIAEASGSDTSASGSPS